MLGGGEKEKEEEKTCKWLMERGLMQELRKWEMGHNLKLLLLSG